MSTGIPETNRYLLISLLGPGDIMDTTMTLEESRETDENTNHWSPVMDGRG